MGSGRSQRWSPRSRPPSLGDFRVTCTVTATCQTAPPAGRAGSAPTCPPPCPPLPSEPPSRHRGPSGRLGGGGSELRARTGRLREAGYQLGAWGIRRFLGTAHGGASADTAPRPGTRGGPAAHLELLAQVVVALAGLGRHRHVEVLALLLAQQLEPAGDRARPRLTHAARATRTGGGAWGRRARSAGRVCAHARVRGCVHVWGRACV